MGKQIFNIKGMTQDLSPSKTPNDFAYEIRNLRLTAQEDSTMLSLVSEKGNAQYRLMNLNNDSNFIIYGTIVGYCTVGTEYLVLFTHGNTTGDCIYRLSEASNNVMLCECLYGCGVGHIKNLGFTNTTNIESIGVYENSDMQKVYWIDGVNQPRVINIVADNATITKWDTMSICPFDFMIEMRLEESVTITKRTELFGIFAPGTIQYVFSYYSSTGQYSPAFYMSPLWYITLNKNAVAPDSTGSGAFQITIGSETVDTSFDYVAIYSIQRTSENGTPICKKVADLKITDFGDDDITYIDNGLSTEVVDYSEILYLGGSNIVPYTMEQKTNTLFFGNITSNDFVINDDDIAVIKEWTILSWSYGHSVQIAETKNTYYPYKNQLNDSADTITTFKFGESYYFGIIAQNKYGQWSNVVPLNTERLQNTLPPIDSQENYNSINLVVTFNQTAINLLNNLGCKKVRVVRLDEAPQIVCQGVLSPTVFNKSRKTENGINYAQSSWYFRPLKSANRNYIEDNKAQYYHNRNLRFVADTNCNEVQGSSESDLLFDTRPASSLTDMDMFVDWNILTLHSPELEWGNSNESENIEHLKIVGVVPVQYGVTSMFLELASPPYSTSGGMRPITFMDSSYATNNAPLCLSNYYYTDTVYGVNRAIDWGNSLEYYMIFPWHRFSSLTSQRTPDANNNWYSELKSKCMASMRASYVSHFINGAYQSMSTAYDIDITPFKTVDTSTNAVLIPSDTHCDNKVRMYLGNVDTALSGDMESYGKADRNDPDESATLLSRENSTIRMSYKSSSHGVFSIKYGDGNIQRVMPYTMKPTLASTTKSSDAYYPDNFIAKGIIIDPDANYIDDGETQKLIIFMKKDHVHKYVPERLNPGDMVLFRKEHDLNNENDLYQQPRFVIDPSPDSMAASMYSPSLWYHFRTIEARDYLDGETGVEYLTHFCNGSPGHEGDKAYYYIYYYVDKNNEKLYNEYGEESLTIYRVYKKSGYNETSYGITAELVETFEWTSESNFEELPRMQLPAITQTYDYLYLADLIRNPRPELSNFAGSKWLLSGTIHSIPTPQANTIYGDIGDTYMQRYDCLKTFAYSPESQNQVVDILSFMCETRINIDGRYDNRRGGNNNTANNNTNFNLINLAYSQLDNFYTPQYLNPDIKNITYFPNKIMWTGTKVYGSQIDKWTHIISTSSLDMDGNYGSITALKLWNDQLLCFQDKALARVQYNDRTAIATTAGVPIELANSGKVDGREYLSTNIGCSNKNSIATTQEGIYFIDSNTREIYRWTKSLESLSKSKGFNTYMQKVTLNSEKTFYDPKLKDVYFRMERTDTNPTTTEYLVFNEQIGEFTSFFDYDMDFLFALNDSLVAVEHNSHNLWKQFAGHSYLNYFGRTSGGNPVYETYKIQLVSADYPTRDKIFTGVEFRADILNGNITQTGVQSSPNTGYASTNAIPFQTLRVWNEYQDTGTIHFQNMLRKGSDLAQKFRIWRGLIGRDAIHKLDRIRSPWARLEFTGGVNNMKTVIHDIAVTYV